LNIREDMSMSTNTIHKCFGVVVQDESGIPDEVREFVEELFGNAGLGERIEFDDSDLDRLVSAKAVQSVYHGYSNAQPAVFGIVLDDSSVNRRSVLRLVGGNAQNLDDYDLKRIQKWKEGPAAPYLNLLDKHGLELQVCWLVGTN
jgi:hypothetical protein